ERINNKQSSSYKSRQSFGKAVKRVLQSLPKETLRSFSDLRRSNVLPQSHMTYRNCLCAYHENINLLIKPLSKYIPCPGLHSLQAFSSTLVGCETNEECMFSQCSLCANNFENKIIKHAT
ncbi:unnamed protein product, partial [Rotaria sp. Silwood2]